MKKTSKSKKLIIKSINNSEVDLKSTLYSIRNSFKRNICVSFLITSKEIVLLECRLPPKELDYSLEGDDSPSGSGDLHNRKVRVDYFG